MVPRFLGTVQWLFCGSCSMAGDRLTNTRCALNCLLTQTVRSLMPHEKQIPPYGGACFSLAALHHPYQSDYLAKDLHMIRNDRIHSIIFRLQAVMVFFLKETLYSSGII